jgi:beta-phosphoglucomutase-like phosphatase (HAD superfamily)
MSEAIAAVVFDLDGVLIDSESVWDAARREVVARNGGRWQADATRTMMGMSSPEWSRYLHDQLGVPAHYGQVLGNESVTAKSPATPSKESIMTARLFTEAVDEK